jgi:3-deoxy-D-manno-octulosonic acid (KDO) 8-phosphate synthase
LYATGIFLPAVVFPLSPQTFGVLELLCQVIYNNIVIITHENTNKNVNRMPNDVLNIPLFLAGQTDRLIGLLV